MRHGLVFLLVSSSCAALCAGALAACATSQDLGGDAVDGGNGNGGDGSTATAEGGASGDGGTQGTTDGGSTGSDGGGSEGDGGVHPGQRLVSGGQGFTCAITPGGAVKCWGTDFFGTLGDGQTLNNPVSTPTATKVLTSGVVALTARFRHTCALTSGGAVYCWGQSSEGATGTDNDTSTPALVTGLGVGVAEIAAGDNHTCARMTTGAVKCWGGNLDHQIGNDNVAAQTSMPTDTAVTSGALQITAGADHTCVRLASGVSCWGSHAMGVLGSGAAASTATPVAVPGTAGAVDIAASGTNTCALDANGAVKCWGSGIGPFTATTWTPVGLASLFPGGIYHMCGITKTGAILCWGSDAEGELGDGTNKGGSGPIGPMGITAVSVGTGDEFTCAMLSGGGISCWGLNDAYQLGNTKSTPNTYSPTVVAGF